MSQILRALVVVGCIAIGAIAVQIVLQTALSGEGKEVDELTRAEKLERIFSEPGAPPATAPAVTGSS